MGPTHRDEFIQHAVAAHPIDTRTSADEISRLLGNANDQEFLAQYQEQGNVVWVPVCCFVTR
jgi:hypothetical protein